MTLYTYHTRSSVIFIGPGLLGFLGRGLCVYNVFGWALRGYNTYTEIFYSIASCYKSYRGILLHGKCMAFYSGA